MVEKLRVTKIKVLEFIFICLEKALEYANRSCEQPRHCEGVSVTCVEVYEGRGTPLQYSCLENPMDEGAWWARAHGVMQSWT